MNFILTGAALKFFPVLLLLFCHKRETFCIIRTETGEFQQSRNTLETIAFFLSYSEITLAV